MLQPNYTFTNSIVHALCAIEKIKTTIDSILLSQSMLAKLRATARLETIHYSTKIEGNLLTLEQVKEVVAHAGNFAGRQRDEGEVLGYYAALDEVDRLVKGKIAMSETVIKKLLALVMGGGKTTVKPTPYRDSQNVIRDGMRGGIVYLPPEQSDVPDLMSELVAWVQQASENNIPIPLQAAMVHYQFVTVHPYFDGNGRTARLLATLLLHEAGYDLKGLYCLEEYYAKDLDAYYKALTVGPSHNYYLGRAEADITDWLTYFCQSMVKSFERVLQRAQEALSTEKDLSGSFAGLDSRQRAVLTLFNQKSTVTSHDIQQFFNLQPRTVRLLCQQWVEGGFLKIVDASKKKRSYKLANKYKV